MECCRTSLSLHLIREKSHQGGFWTYKRSGDGDGQLFLPGRLADASSRRATQARSASPRLLIHVRCIPSNRWLASHSRKPNHIPPIIPRTSWLLRSPLLKMTCPNGLGTAVAARELYTPASGILSERSGQCFHLLLPFLALSPVVRPVCRFPHRHTHRFHRLSLRSGKAILGLFILPFFETYQTHTRDTPNRVDANSQLLIE